MIDATALGWIAAWGAILGLVVYSVLVVVAIVWAFQGRIKEGVSRRDRLRVYVTVLPKYAYHEPDWKRVALLAPGAMFFCSALLVVVTIFGVGFVEVFFT